MSKRIFVLVSHMSTQCTHCDDKSWAGNTTGAHRKYFIILYTHMSIRPSTLAAPRNIFFTLNVIKYTKILVRFYFLPKKLQLNFVLFFGELCPRAMNYILIYILWINKYFQPKFSIRRIHWMPLNKWLGFSRSKRKKL